MKKLLFPILLLSLFACEKEVEAPVIGIDPEEITFTAEGGTHSFNISANGPWHIPYDNNGWYTFDALAGEGNATVKITVGEWTDATDRTASVKIISENSSGNAKASLTIIQKRKDAPVTPGTEKLEIRARGGDKILDAPAGYTYRVSIPSDITWISVTGQNEDNFTLHLEENSSGSDRSAAITVVNSENETLSTINAVQSWRNIFPGEFLIEELFYTGNIIDETGRPDIYQGDQYVIITNNSDETLYADGLMFMEAKINSAQNYEFIEDIKPEYCGVQAIYVIPGSGTDVPVEPHRSILIANNAQNHKTANHNSFDLSGADYEWYDESTNSAVLDTDNPAVPNLDKWFCYSLTIWTMHNRGFVGYCIAMPPVDMDMEKFLENYRWEGQYIMHTQAGDFTMDITNAYKVPNSWVIDAVNLSVEEVFFTLSFDTSLDAGYAYCGTTDGDPNQYGKAVIRKSDGNGYLVDTNNSTSDFISNTTPSMAR